MTFFKSGDSRKMYDLTRINEEFQKFLKSSFKDSFNPDDMEITEELFKKGNSVFIPFGTMRYRLIVMNGNPVLHIRLRSRMDLDGVVYIDNESIRFRDLWDEKMGNMDGGCKLCGKMDEGYFRCPVCGRRVMHRNYLSKFKRMEEKYGTSNLLELSKEKLTNISKMQKRRNIQKSH